MPTGPARRSLVDHLRAASARVPPQARDTTRNFTCTPQAARPRAPSTRDQQHFVPSLLPPSSPPLHAPAEAGSCCSKTRAEMMSEGLSAGRARGPLPSGGGGGGGGAEVEDRQEKIFIKKEGKEDDTALAIPRNHKRIECANNLAT